MPPRSPAFFHYTILHLLFLFLGLISPQPGLSQDTIRTQATSESTVTTNGSTVTTNESTVTTNETAVTSPRNQPSNQLQGKPSVIPSNQTANQLHGKPSAISPNQPPNEPGSKPASDPLSIHSRSLIWPTNASRILTSTFGETRSAHLHAGIDIRTWGREGYEVYAMADGDVMRIQTGPKGYGNAVYLRHDDGSITMAAHLNRFEPSLQAYTDSLRLAWQQASIDLYPLDRPFRYKAGERIGFSGSTGTGPPHLHVELRNAQNEPVNPLLSSLRDDVKDTRAPEFAALAIEHLDRSTYHLHRHEVLKEKQVTAGIDDFGTVEISGPVGLAALMHDRADGTNSRYAVYEWMMVVRGDTLFHARADRFPFSMDQKMFLDRSFPLLAETGDGFQRFYVVNRNQLPFYKTVKNRGVLHFLPGEYEVRLIAQDLFGNQKESVVRFRMAEARENDAGENDARQDDARQDSLRIDGALEDDVREDDVREETSSIENEAIFADPAQPVHSANPPNPIHAPAGGIFRVVESVPAYPLPSLQQKNHTRNENSAPIPFARYPAQKDVEPVALSHQPEQKTTQRNVHTQLFLESEPRSPAHNSLDIDESKPQEGTFVQVRAHLAPGQPTMLHTPDQRIQLLIPRDALYDSLEVVMSVAWRDGLPEIAFDPGGLPVYEDLRLRVQLPDSVAQAGRVGVFGRHPRTGKLIFLGAERAGHWIESPMMELANVILVRDDEAPLPGMPDLRRNLAGKMVVVVPVRDEGSGVDPEASHVFVDGVRGITDYDPDKKELIYSHPEFVPRKGVDVRVESQDGVGNRSVIRYAAGRW